MKTFDECFKKVEGFFNNVKKSELKPNKEKVHSVGKLIKESEVKEADQYEESLDQLKEIHNKLRRDYKEKLASNTFLKELKFPPLTETDSDDLKEKTFDYCFEELKKFFNGITESKKPGVENAGVENAWKCLKNMKKIHDTLNSHLNACKEKGTCEEPRTQASGSPFYDWRKD